MMEARALVLASLTDGGSQPSSHLGSLIDSQLLIVVSVILRRTIRSLDRVTTQMRLH